MFYGERLLTTDNPEADHDHKLFDRLGMQMESTPLETDQKACCGG
jgi:biotin synthase